MAFNLYPFRLSRNSRKLGFQLCNVAVPRGFANVTVCGWLILAVAQNDKPLAIHMAYKSILWGGANEMAI
jgi:hypothetical protein